ncbi:MAG: DUF4148 domain-containing protein [Burkholderiaceae bacterium]|nr:MAG: DUF4148 domain-containing protein [Burkholderiaceae bacterium]
MTQQRLSLSSMIAAAAAVAALGLPGLASAAGHPANDQAGVVVHPERFKSEKTREQVSAEAKAAMKQGRISYGEGAYSVPALDAGPGKTRQQVVNELLNESPAERSARLNSRAGG